MADIQEEIRSLTDVLDEVTKASIFLRGTQANPGLIQQLKESTEAAREMSERLGTPHALIEQIKDLSAYSRELPEQLLSKVDGVAFRAALSRAIVEVTGAEIEKLHQIVLDHLDNELKFRADRLADDIFTRKMAPAMAAANELARAKSDAESYKTRAETAEELLGNIEILSKKTEGDLIDRIEKIRLSATQPNRWALFAVFALGWGCALFAADAWSALTHWLFQQPIPVWFLPRT